MVDRRAKNRFFVTIIRNSTFRPLLLDLLRDFEVLFLRYTLYLYLLEIKVHYPFDLFILSRPHRFPFDSFNISTVAADGEG